MLQALCPVVVARDDELAALNGRLAAARSGSGSFLVLAGEAGVGKSRIARMLARRARESGAAVLRGRAVAGSMAGPYRPLAEAIMSGLRERPLPETAELAPFRPALGRIVPQWYRTDLAGSAESGIVVGEGVLRLLRALAGPGSTLLVVEDVHEADPESLSVLEYLSDNVHDQPVIVLATQRSGERSRGARLVHDLAARRTATVIDLRRLPAGEVAAMAAACLGTAELPASLMAALERADGLPFLVEELLASWLAAGTLVRAGGSWAFDPRGSRAVPQTVAESVRHRLARWYPADVEVLRCAATLGWRFSWDLVPPMLDLHPLRVLAALRRCVEHQFLAADGDGFQFRHALTRDAVLDELVADERRRLAARALAALRAQHPDLPGGRRELAAELAEAAGDGAAAARSWCEVARRNVATGALGSAEVAVERAAIHRPARGEADGLLLEVVSLAGDVERTLAVGRRVLDREAAGPARTAALLRVARAAVTAGRWSVAVEHLACARAGAGLDRDRAALAVCDTLAAAVALGEGHVATAADLAGSAVAAARAQARTDVECEALEVLGRVRRLDDLDAAEETFIRAHERATEHGLRLWQVRALHELGILDVVRMQGPRRLLQARVLASEMGALATVASIDLHLAAAGNLALYPHEPLAAARRCIEAARRWQLAALLPVALAYQAGLLAVAGRDGEADAAVGEALALAGDDRDVRASVLAHTRAMQALLVENQRRALAALDAAADLVRAGPVLTQRPWLGLWALLRSAAPEGDGACVRAEVRGWAAPGIRVIHAMVDMGEAVALGRAGRPRDAERVFAAADAELAAIPPARGYHRIARRVVAEAALTDEWGEPLDWLRDAAAFFAGTGHERVELACRSLLRGAGVPLPRREYGRADVPPRLAERGITSREAAVLALVSQRLSSAEIGERLFISPRTVDKHVERLLQKTGTTRRAELATWWAAVGT